MRDTLEIFGERLPELAAVWRNDLAGQLSLRQRNVILRAAQKIFGEVSNDIRRAARIPQDRELDPEQLRQIGNICFAELFCDGAQSE